MNGLEIREAINELNRQLEAKLTPTFFTLNKEVIETRKAIEELQAKCHHEYDSLGYCIYCDKRVN